MKARVKATGEIIDETAMVSTLGDDFYLRELEPISENTEVIDYWTRLEHQYAGMAMQGMLNNSYLAGEFRKDPNNGIKDMSNIITKAAIVYAHALVQKMKEEK